MKRRLLKFEKTGILGTGPPPGGLLWLISSSLLITRILKALWRWILTLEDSETSEPGSAGDTRSVDELGEANSAGKEEWLCWLCAVSGISSPEKRGYLPVSGVGFGDGRVPDGRRKEGDDGAKPGVPWLLGRAEEGIGRCRMDRQIGRRWNPIRPDHEFLVRGKRVLIRLLVTAIGLKSEMNPVLSLTR